MDDEELQQADDVNFDEFNFDDLTDGKIEDDSLDDVSEFDLGDMSIDDLDFDVLDNGADEKESPFVTSASKFLEDNLDDQNHLAEGEEAKTIDGDDAEKNFSEERKEPFFDAPVFDDENNESVSVEENAEVFEESVNSESVFENVLLKEDEGISDFPVMNNDFDNQDLISEQIKEDEVSEKFVVDEEQENNVVGGNLDEEQDFFEQPVQEAISDLSNSGELETEENFEDMHQEYFSADDGDEVAAENILTEDSRDSFPEEGYSVVSNVDLSKNIGYLKWYSGDVDAKMFQISKGFDSGSFDANEECKTIHVNVGYDMYGWEVQFSDGIVMNLRDIREYQMRNGRLPSADGRIIYGHSSLMFSGVERIVVYESVKYFSYGI